MMTNAQLYIAVAIPTLAVLINMLAQFQMIQSLRNEMVSLRIEVTARLDQVDKRLDQMDKRIDRVEMTLEYMRTEFVKDHSERITRLEERLYRSA